MAAASSASAKSWLSLQMKDRDKIVLVHWETSLVQTIQATISRLWPKGIQEKQETSDYVCFKLAGRPFGVANFFGENIAEQDEAIEFMLQIIAELNRAGWSFCFSSIISLGSVEGNSMIWFFEKRQRTEKPPAPTFAICLRGYDRVAITNGDENYQILKKIMAPLVQDEKVLPSFSLVKLMGKMWASLDWEETVIGGMILLAFVRRMAEREYRLTGVANVRPRTEMMLFEKAASVGREEEFTAMFLVTADRIQLIDVPLNSKIIETVRQCILKHWNFEGIQYFRGSEENEVADSGICVEFKLRGYPWGGAEDSRNAKFLLIAVLKSLREIGWETYREFVVPRPRKERVCILLRSCEPASLPHFGLWLRQSDRVEILTADHQLTEIFAKTVRSNWPKEIQHEVRSENGFEIKLKGNPWCGNAEDSALGCRLLTALLETFSSLGWRVIAAPDLNWACGRRGEMYSDNKSIWVFAYTECHKSVVGCSSTPMDPVTDDLPLYDDVKNYEMRRFVHFTVDAVTPTIVKFLMRK